MSELLAPAGNIEALDAAIGEGADAIYMGLKSFNARLRTSNFAWNQFEAAVNAVHKKGKKIYVTVNTVAEEFEMERMFRFLSYINSVGPDAILVQDFGVVRMCQEFFPKLPLHASTQMNCSSAAAVNLLSREGFSRVVLGRELSLQEIKKIKESTNAELECFVHGALCVSESGLCMFSSFLGGKSANRGMCTQACRRLYTASDEGMDKKGYYFSPNDLQLIDKIPELDMIGVESFKIEGRMKSAEYVGSVTAAYRYVLDHWKEDKKGAIETGKRMLATDFARAKTRFFFDCGNSAGGGKPSGDGGLGKASGLGYGGGLGCGGGKPSGDGGLGGLGNVSVNAESFLNPDQAGGTGIYLGKIDKVKTLEMKVAADYVEGQTEVKSVTIKQPFALLKNGNYDPEQGDSIRLHKKDDSGRESHKIRQVRQDENGRWIDIPSGFGSGDSVYLLQTKAMSKRYQRVLPNDLSMFRKQPGGQIAPIMDLTQFPKNGLDYFPDGVYVQVSTLQDMYALLGERQIRVILELNSETKRDLIDFKKTLPFSKRQVFISLDPYCPQGIEENLAQTIDFLVADGFKNWVVNNPSHIGLLRNKKATMIAGPYLYTFNRWAVSWLENQNIEAFITPLENSRKNLEATLDPEFRKKAMITLFAYPALFRMRFKLPESYDFIFFADKEGTEFKALSTEDGSFVMPEKPFSIIDNMQKMQKLGFTHFLLDFSKTQVDKSEFRYIMRALFKGEVLPETNRFNWKDGFYSPEKMEERRLAQQRAAEEAKRTKHQYSGKGRGSGQARDSGQRRGKKRS